MASVVVSRRGWELLWMLLQAHDPELNQTVSDARFWQKAVRWSYENLGENLR